MNKMFTFNLKVYESVQNEFIFARLKCCHFQPETTNIDIYQIVSF